MNILNDIQEYDDWRQQNVTLHDNEPANLRVGMVDVAVAPVLRLVRSGGGRGIVGSHFLRRCGCTAGCLQVRATNVG